MADSGRGSPPASPRSYFGIIVQPTFNGNGSELVYAEIEPAYSRWLPWPGRTSRWWYEVHSEGQPDELGITSSTYGYVERGSGGAFTLRGCVRKATRAVAFFADEYLDPFRPSTPDTGKPSV